MSKIQDLPILERPREKALRYGISSLSDVELLAIILATGYQGENVTQVANNLLNSTCGLYGLSYTSLSDLMKCKGIKENKALILSSVFEIHNRLIKRESERDETIINSEYLYNKYKNELNHYSQEVLILIIVDKKNSPIYETILYKGNDSNIMFSPKDIWRELLTHKGKGYYLIHNHPSGDHNPSKEDITLTADLLRESKKLKVNLLDHIVVGENGYTSISSLLKVS